MPKNRFNEVRAQCPLGTRWLWFYTKVILLLNIIFNFIASIKVLKVVPEIKTIRLSAFHTFQLVLLLVIIVACVGLSCMAYVGLLKFTKAGYNYNIAYLWVVSVSNVVTETVKADITIQSVLLPLIGSVIWLLPNLIYFKKRKSLFGSPAVDAEIPDIAV